MSQLLVARCLPPVSPESTLLPFTYFYHAPSVPFAEHRLISGPVITSASSGRTNFASRFSTGVVAVELIVIVDTLGLPRDPVPRELFKATGPAALAHGLSALKIVEHLRYAPGNTATFRVDVEAVIFVTHKFAGSAAMGNHDRFRTRPALKHYNAERLISGRDYHAITGPEKVLQLDACLGAYKSHSVADIQLMGTALEFLPHFALPDKDDNCIASGGKDARNCIHEDVRALLRRQASREQDHRLKSAYSIPRLEVLAIRLNESFEVVQLDTIVNHSELILAIVHLHFVAETTGNRNDPVSILAPLALDFPDLPGDPAVNVLVTTSAVFCGVHSQDASPSSLLELHQSLRRQPVVTMNDIE